MWIWLSAEVLEAVQSRLSLLRALPFCAALWAALTPLLKRFSQIHLYTIQTMYVNTTAKDTAARTMTAVNTPPAQENADTAAANSKTVSDVPEFNMKGRLKTHDSCK